ncbi:fatty acyl-CoA reductase 3-like [Cucurbita moschata]|uniref:Fatty acyl-CoA reductase n=1 Tax=Cucurbita moschata TaxID=3662 RepID=A0A6J1FTJ1_CUCMO|nr:fatty acyl-CoA reductase 3-like [Cucurbita moschata]
MDFLENKTIFVIGAKGFLGKIMVEKILRAHHNVKKLYLLLRNVDQITASKHFYDEVVEKELFRVLKEKWGGDLKTLISEKIYLVPGDISSPNMGLKDSNLLEEMKNEVEIIVNFAATTNFDERYDVAFSTNTLGARHVLNFAEQCSNLKILVHVSTAYVSNQREGVILETPCKLVESVDGTSKLDFETERKIIEDSLRELRNNKDIDEITRSLTMKDLGTKRAKMYGYPNTYTFTKAMGEMLINDKSDNLRLIIVRPTIVTSTYKEPFPGWIEGLRTIDGLIDGYGKGKLAFFPSNASSILDVIPADMVVNGIIMAILAHKLQPFGHTLIYHIGSSMRNAMSNIDLCSYILQYFTEKPWIDKDGKTIKIKKLTLFNDMASFHRHMTIRYLIFLKGFEFVNRAFCYAFQDKCNDLRGKFDWVMRQVELYDSFLFFKARFDDTNLEKLRIAARDNNINPNTSLLDPEDINWEDYFLNIHIPGLIKHVVEKELFRVLKEQWGGDLKPLISEKICLVPGDISSPNMGLNDSDLLEEMKNQVEIIINFAATTNFDERYDVAFGTNTLGAKHVVNFAKGCSNLEILVHVSTAFVSNQRDGVILETPCKLVESVDGTSKLDIETERKIIEDSLRELRNNRDINEITRSLAMKDLGTKRSKMYGYPNTYTFTKAMGEMLVNDKIDNLPLIIMRPTIVTSTYKEPFPGWIEGLRTIDGFIVGYAKGKVTHFPSGAGSILDLIPAHMVVNAIIMAISAHKLQPSRHTIIYHVSSSMRNSISNINSLNYILRYFTEKPWINKDGKTIKIKKLTLFNDLASFYRYMTIRYLVLLKGFEFANKAFCNSFQHKYNDLQRKFNWVMRQIELYNSFLFFKARFDDTNLEKLRIAARDNNINPNTSLLDPKDINWEDYFLNIHIPGLVKHVMK